MSTLSLVDGEQEHQPAQLRLGEFEGLKINTARLNFAGNVLVDDQRLVEALRLNADVELVISGRVVGRSHSTKRDGEGYVKETVTSSTLYIENLAVVSDEPEPTG